MRRIPMAAPERYLFGAFALDVTERRVTKDGRPVPLAPKAFEVLTLLVRHAGQLVTKQDLLDGVWPGRFVEEGILTVHVAALRKALGERSRLPRWIETVPRSGYRFAGPVARAADEAESRPRSALEYELVGRGRFHLLSASRQEVTLAVNAFRSAAEREPTYAAAHAWLALACCAQAELRLGPSRDAFNEARAAALRALAMDATCAEAQVALGVVLFLGDWNWLAAERSFRRALQANPDYTEAYLLYGRLLEALGRVQEGLDLKLRALERDPASPVVHLQIALAYWHLRRYGAVIEWANRTLALNPRHSLAHEYLAAAYLQQGDADRHMAESLAHAEVNGVPAALLMPLKEAYAADGRRGVLAHVLRMAPAGEPLPAVQLALMHAELGELDRAFEHLDRAIDARDPALVHLAVAPQWDCLRHDPRFTERLTRMGLGRRSLTG